jgi:hypothetical protein
MGEGTRGADFGGVPLLCYGGGHLWQKKKVSPATKWDNTMFTFAEKGSAGRDIITVKKHSK